MDIATMLRYADAHGRAIREGDEAHAQADLAEAFRETANSIATTLPHPVTSYEVVAVRVDSGVGTVQIRYDGTGPTRIIESKSEHRGGRPILFDAAPVQ